METPDKETQDTRHQPKHMSWVCAPSPDQYTSANRTAENLPIIQEAQVADLGCWLDATKNIDNLQHALCASETNRQRGVKRWVDVLQCLTQFGTTKLLEKGAGP